LRNAVLMDDSILTDPVEMGKVVETAVYKHVAAFYYKKATSVGYYRGGRKDKEVDVVVEYELSMKTKPLVIGIISSAHACSNSAVLVRESLKGASEKGAETKKIYLPEYDLEYCTGCLSCMKYGKC
jgi:hypothetical protein